MDSASIYVALGSNLGDRLASLSRALDALQAHPAIELARASAAYETEPMYVLDQPLFLNAVAALRSSLEPVALLEALLSIEQGLGRVRAERRGPRAIDLDLLAHGARTISTSRLTLPHPGIAERPFVLEPWAEIAPSFFVAGLEQSVGALRDAARARYLSAPKKLSPIDHGTPK